MLINATKYSIRATLYLGANSSMTQKVSARNIAEELGVPLPFLAKLLQQLTKKKIISSTKGPNGGFYLNDINRKKTVWDIINCIDGAEEFTECLLGLSQCNDSNPCAIHHLVTPFRKQIMLEFKDKSIAQLAKEINEGNRITI